MKRPGPAHLETASKLLSLERADRAGARERGDAAARVHEKLLVRLSPVLGSAGVQTLFTRSVKLASVGYPALAGVVSEAMEEQGAQLRDCFQRQEEVAATEAAVALFATFLGLLATFIGEGLTMKVLRAAWPGIGDIVPREKQK
jgi:hypothetical protein